MGLAFFKKRFCAWRGAPLNRRLASEDTVEGWWRICDDKCSNAQNKFEGLFDGQQKIARAKDESTEAAAPVITN